MSGSGDGIGGLRYNRHDGGGYVSSDNPPPVGDSATAGIGNRRKEATTGSAAPGDGSLFRRQVLTFIRGSNQDPATHSVPPKIDGAYWVLGILIGGGKGWRGHYDGWTVFRRPQISVPARLVLSEMSGASPASQNDDLVLYHVGVSRSTSSKVCLDVLG
ncbi:hypothetical protein L1987_48292 [Smallanthus sonchifolius]|uniref:Uncharacterized protein n=1 Tax=Smallanthus sonchifolius TaxID=185202 RepID=A0ACB9FRL0_9ASTR|nr:hypothetical protein L1987_48292 [Smallanthus sonchifolius]